MKRSALLSALLGVLSIATSSADLPLVRDVEMQPLLAQVRRLITALDLAGAPMPAAVQAELTALASAPDPADALVKVQTLLDARCLLAVEINPEMRVKVARGPAAAELVQHGWRQFLIKVANESGTTAPLKVTSPQAQSVYAGGWPQTLSDRALRPKSGLGKIDPTELWLDVETLDRQPLNPTLSGLRLEYRIISLYSRDHGQRDATLAFDVGQGTQDLGYRSEISILFHCQPAQEVTLRIQDDNGKPCMASLVIRDALGRVHPSTAKRLAPDFGFHPQIYRADGEKITLPSGAYVIDFTRGPEALVETRKIEVGDGPMELAFKVQRWIDPAGLGWWSGDHHIHAAGCAHYTNPTEGVHAEDMMRHCLGEDLKVGANLTWGPCFDYQKQFFTGKDDAVARFPYLLRYDVEVSGFGSHQSGHLCLLSLREQMYPGGTSMKHWPTLGLNTLRWARRQGALCGPAHSGAGLAIKDTNLPSLEMPKFDGIGANEYIVDVTHELPGPDGKPAPAVDFISTVDTPYPWELNIWYHTLNAGFRTRISGETDFPCVYGERVGLGRSYVKLPPQWTYEDWCEGIRAGRNYVSDGQSHLLDFQINDVAMGEKGSELRLDAPGTVHISARVAARLGEKPDDAIRRAGVAQKPYWHLERARLGDSREVPVEVLVNGISVARKNIVADGMLRDITFDVPVQRSSWIALRILPSSHTNPVFTLVGGKPIRASKESIEWCRRAVDQCWSQKERTYAAAEKAEAQAAYDHARATYERLLTEVIE